MQSLAVGGNMSMLKKARLESGRLWEILAVGVGSQDMETTVRLRCEFTHAAGTVQHPF